MNIDMNILSSCSDVLEQLCMINFYLSLVESHSLLPETSYFSSLLSEPI